MVFLRKNSRQILPMINLARLLYAVCEKLANCFQCDYRQIVLCAALGSFQVSVADYSFLGPLFLLSF